MAFLPYLNFGGNCREAFTRYHEVFGGNLMLLSMADMPGGAGDSVPADQADLIMHAALMFDDGSILMASDAQAGVPFGPVQGMYVNYTTADTAEAERVFKELSEGGEVAMPLEETFWSPRFGVVTDRFGTPWMVNAQAEEAWTPDS